MAERLDRFLHLHGSARAGDLLPPPEDTEYRSLLDVFLRACADAQNQSYAVMREHRASPRVRRAVQAQLRVDDAGLRTTTFDVALGGFSALLPCPLTAGAVVEFSLQLSRGSKVAGRARVVETRSRGREARVSFAYVNLQLGSSALESFVVEALLSDLVPGTRFFEDVSSLLTNGTLAPVLRRLPPPERLDGAPVLTRMRQAAR